MMMSRIFLTIEPMVQCNTGTFIHFRPTNETSVSIRERLKHELFWLNGKEVMFRDIATSLG